MPRVTPTMRRVLQVLSRERPLTEHAIAGALSLPVRRIEDAIARLKGENLVRVAGFDRMGYPAFEKGSPVVVIERRRRRVRLR